MTSPAGTKKAHSDGSAGSGGSGAGAGGSGAGGAGSGGSGTGGMSGAGGSGAGGEGGVPGGGEDPGECGYIHACAEGCSDKACVDDCAKEGTPEAQMLYTMYRSCVRETCCTATERCGGTPTMCDQVKSGTKECCDCIYESMCKGVKEEGGPPDPAQAKCAQLWADCRGMAIADISCPLASGCKKAGP